MSMLDPSAKAAALRLRESDDADVREYADTLLRYGELCEQGREDTAAADDLVRTLDRMWLALDADQIKQVDSHIASASTVSISTKDP